MPSLSIEFREHIAIVTIDRPPVNAVDTDALREIRDAFRSLNENRDVRVAILTAAGDRAFVAGADLRARGREPDPNAPPRPPSEQLDAGLVARDAFWSITDCAVPVIGAINGPAIGAGLALAACCDMIIASENATFGTTEINVGLLGASSHLLLLVPRHKAREMFLTGEMVPAAELHRLGSVRAVVPRAALLDAALELAGVLASKSPIAMRLAKDSMNRVEHLPLKEAYRTEQDYTARLGRYEDSREARVAFLERRDPTFNWR